MAEYIKREAAIAYIREQSEECQKAFEELGGESGIYADAYNDLAEDFYGIPAAKAVSLHDIYRVIAGHSYYHGDRILAALTCIAEGKEVNPVRPSDVAPMEHGRWNADAILKADENSDKALVLGSGKALEIAYALLKKKVEDAPIVDAVAVTRCKDCKHLCVWNRKDIYAFCPKTNIVFLPFERDSRTFFCSFGERKPSADG